MGGQTVRLAIYLPAAAGLLLGGILILRVAYRRIYRQHGRLTPLAIVLGTLVWFAVGGFPAIYLPRDWPAVHLPLAVEILGWLLLSGGLLLLLAGMASLGLGAAIGQGRPELMTRGLYRYSRNPQIVGCGLYCLGFVVLWPSWYAAGWLLIFAVLARAMIVTEEEHLRRVFGQEYLDYCALVPCGFVPRGLRRRR